MAPLESAAELRGVSLSSYKYSDDLTLTLTLFLPQAQTAFYDLRQRLIRILKTPWYYISFRLVCQQTTPRSCAQSVKPALVSPASCFALQPARNRAWQVWDGCEGLQVSEQAWVCCVENILIHFGVHFDSWAAAVRLLSWLFFQKTTLR